MHKLKILRKDKSMKRMMLLFGLFFVSSLFAVDATTLYKKCAGCHGLKGEKTNFAKIQGLSKGDVVAKLKGYQKGQGGAKKAMMSAQVKSLDSGQIEALAQYISTF